MSERETAGIEKIWDGLSQERLAWAFRAYDRFINSLSDDVRDRFPKGDAQGEAYVVVFGKTQVGKTTLILDLMGLSGRSLIRVSKILRGGREAGKSATSTAMEYRRSNDDQWWFSSGATSIFGAYDDSGMENALGDIREQMFQKRLKADKPFIVWIPNDCFDGDENAGFSVRMLDLPGDHAADAVERKHVQQMAQNYVPNADLILLVGKGDDLSFLKPTSLELPSIEDWQIVPNRFRIVTTYSFTAQSVRDVLEQQKTVGVEFFRKRLLEQIRTFGLKLEDDAAETKRFFPLEFGDSWVNAKQALVTALNPVNTSLKDQLHRDIQASATPNVRLRNAVNVHVTVGKIKESRLKKMDEALNEVKKSQGDVASECKVLTTAWAQAKKQTDAEKEFLVALPYDKLKQQVVNEVVFDVKNLLDKVENLGTNTSHLKSLISQFKSDLKSLFLSAKPTKEKKFWASVQPRLDQHVGKVEEIVDAEFGQLLNKLSDYWRTEYFPSMSDDFSNDKRSMRTHMQNCADSASAWAAKQWQGWAKKRLQQLSDDMESGTAHQNALQNALKEREKTLGRFDSQIKYDEQERSIFVKKMETDESSSRKFVALLEQSYLDELFDRRLRITKASSAAHAFIELLATDQLIHERNKLINTLS